MLVNMRKMLLIDRVIIELYSTLTHERRLNPLLSFIRPPTITTHPAHESRIMEQEYDHTSIAPSHLTDRNLATDEFRLLQILDQTLQPAEEPRRAAEAQLETLYGNDCSHSFLLLIPRVRIGRLTKSRLLQRFPSPS